MEIERGDATHAFENMAFNNPRVEIGSGAEANLCFDSDLLGIMQGTVKLEQKVAEFFEVLREPVYHYLIAVFGNATEAEDITQESFLRLYRSLHNGQSIANVRCWIFRVAHNLAINQRKHSQFLNPLDAHSWDELRQAVPDTAPNPEQRILEQEKYEHLYIALGRLSQQERQCLHLRAEGFRYREIGEILDIGVPTVGEFLRRGIKKLMVLNNG